MNTLFNLLVILAIWTTTCSYARTAKDDWEARTLTNGERNLARSLINSWFNKRACVPDGGRCGPNSSQGGTCCGNNCFGSGSSGGVCGSPTFDGKFYGYNYSDPNFNDFDTIGAAGLASPEKINVKKWGWVDSIQVDYKGGSSSRSGPTRGGGGGVDCILKLDADERIVKVEGSYATYLDYLQFTTNKGRKGDVCGGSSRNTLFSESKPGYVLSYISGNAGWYLNGIQFHWIREEVSYIISKITYDVSAVANQDLGEPRSVYSTTLTNRSPVDQQTSYTYTFTTSETKSWSMGVGYTLGVSTTVQAGVPEVASVGVTISSEISTSFTYGQDQTTEKSYSQAIQVTVPPHSKITASIIVLEGKVEIPYQSLVTVVFADGTQVTRPGEKGVFKGVQAVTAYADYSDATLA
ncbi:unnamed protein product [Adineta steineri]|uniref:Jacalin-type lectin domain-containing protein n=1 Tax=Adineta steineri TaxID=433720 RepID=A0A813XXE0_9BILA|nr:unnamed protein product [Adineta steineri]